MAQVLVVLFAPLLTRIYSPEIFGLQGVFLAALGLLAPIAAMRFPMAIVLASNQNEVTNVKYLSLATALTMSSLLLAGMMLGGPTLLTHVGLERLGTWAYLLPAALFLTAVQEIVDYEAAREGRFRALSVVTALQALLVNGCRTLLGAFAPVVGTLISISAGSPGIHAALLSCSKPRNRRKTWRWPANIGSRIIATARAHRGFPLMRAPTDLMNAASQTLPVLMLGSLFGPVVAGLYALARSVLNVPSNVIGNAIGSVFYADFADKERQGKQLAPLAFKSTLILLFGPGLVILIFGFFAPQLFGFAFGSEWREAGVYAQWMSIWIAFALANVPSVRLAPVIRRQGTLLFANVVMLALRLVSLVAGFSMTREPVGTIAVYSVTSALCNFGLVVVLILLTRRHDNRRVTTDISDLE